MGCSALIADDPSVGLGLREKVTGSLVYMNHFDGEKSDKAANKVTVSLQAGETYAETATGLRRLKLRAQYRFHLKWIKQYVEHLKSQGIDESDIKLLELGSGPGFFAEALSLALPSVQYTGLEFDPRCIRSAQSKVSPDYTFVEGNVEQFELFDRFDVVVSFQVIEHLYNPESMLRCIDQHLKHAGLFVVTTPNLDGLGARWMKENWSGYRHDHVSLKGRDEWDRFISRGLYRALFTGSTFFSGLPWVVNSPLAIINNLLLFCFGALRWGVGESYVGVFRKRSVK